MFALFFMTKPSDALSTYRVIFKQQSKPQSQTMKNKQFSARIARSIFVPKYTWRCFSYGYWLYKCTQVSNYFQNTILIIIGTMMITIVSI